MRRAILPVLLLACISRSAGAFIEAPHSLGRICRESTNIVVVEVARIDEKRNLIVYKKVKDLKGNHPQEQLKHNVGQRGSHPREWQNVMAWAKVGRRAVFFHNGAASITGIDRYWYQCFKEGEWWAMSHAEPFVLRTYYGSAGRLEGAVADILAGKEVVVPAMVASDKEQFHLRTGKVHQIRASLKLQDYDAKRDFVADGAPKDDAAGAAPAKVARADAAKVREAPRSSGAGGFYRAINLNGPALEIDGRKWEGKDAPDVSVRGNRFENQKIKLSPAADESLARMIRSSIWGEGCRVALGKVPDGVYEVFLYAWEDNAAQVFDVKVNGKTVLSKHSSGPAGAWKRLGPWKVSPRGGSIVVENGSRADANFSGIEVRRVGPTAARDSAGSAQKRVELVVDESARSVTIPCAVAPRKLAHLDEVYPLEVIATWPAPRGQKAHETVVTVSGAKPSEVHAALERIGLKPGKPARGEDARASGPKVRILLELPGEGGKTRRVPVEEALVYRDSGKPLGKSLTWRFTGSVRRQPDPEKDEKVYGADITGTFVAIFPVTDDLVIQSDLTMKDEPGMKLEVDKGLLPREGAAVKLIVRAE